MINFGRNFQLAADNRAQPAQESPPHKALRLPNAPSAEDVYRGDNGPRRFRRGLSAHTGRDERRRAPPARVEGGAVVPHAHAGALGKLARFTMKSAENVFIYNAHRRAAAQQSNSTHPCIDFGPKPAH